MPKPPDWGDHIFVTGYWLLDSPPGWQPPADLAAFIEFGPTPIYVGFGSMSARDPRATTQLIVEALRRTEQRSVLSTGWSGLADADLLESVFAVESIPHDWLFPRMAAVVHHGGAGTTGAGLLAGIPNVIVPAAGDQFLWGEGVEALGVGPKAIPRKRLTVERLAEAIQVAVNDASTRERAKALGECVRADDGIALATRIISNTNV